MGAEVLPTVELKAPIVEETHRSEPCTPAADSKVKCVQAEGGELAAALAVQKLYRGYRTRRNVADCAVMNRKYAWWNVLEGALLQQNSEEFYAYNKPETATTRWVRLKTKAAKVGRGLSKDEKARKLALQHWLEAIDARHRYGHNLHFYYRVWLKSQTPEPFFYWLDVGEGRELDLEECPRKKLQKEQIKYLGPKEREQYEVIIEDGKLIYKQTGELVHTTKGEKWIFVMSTSGQLYVAQKAKGKFQHSSFLAGSATTAAGRLSVSNGVLELMEAHSGHYHPTEENFQMLVNILAQNGADLTLAKVQTVSDDMLPSHLYSRPSFLKETDKLKAAECLDQFVKNDHGAIPEKSVKEMDDTISSKPSKSPILNSDNSAENQQESSYNKENQNRVNITSVKRCFDDSLAKDSTVQTRKEQPKKIFQNECLSYSTLPEDAVAAQKDGTPQDNPSLAVRKGIKKLSSFSWSSGAGGRLSSLSELPNDVRSAAVEYLRQPSPRIKLTQPN